MDEHHLMWCFFFFLTLHQWHFLLQQELPSPRKQRHFSGEYKRSWRDTHRLVVCRWHDSTRTRVFVELVVHPWVSVCTFLHAPRGLQWHVVMAFKRMMDEQSTTCPQKHTLSLTHTDPHTRTHTLKGLILQEIITRRFALIITAGTLC